ncbi:FAD-dependent monooxygenase [Pseudohongiella spirulinae]|uniref:2-octaprenyl-3-methyl-6-methoxy-1,4-benzoquinol hydroxylase n=1 Tax=Pseudohongiella spirulinae TaxID=1249552 RepID=A0A0S2K908_9GAMM|nr:FAD-dependent monooxygenase [Pseudohongiella spirulinae]ALO44822.1 2-octaprenyl-3-methyl-6-methoxy-1,4-benzoquinol hydroxylase [Pseudohongiella spirulinae]
MGQAEQQSFDIIIVGAGMVGATAALALAGSGVRLALLDARPLPTVNQLADNEFDARVSAITHGSQRLFEELQVWPQIQQQRACAYTHMHVREADGTGSIDFDASEVHSDSLGHIIENRVIAQALYAKIEACSNIEVLAPARVSALEKDAEGKYLLRTVEAGDLKAELIVAADGATSPLRALAGIKTREWDYAHQAIVTTVKTTLPHQHTARQIFMDTGVLAFLPLQGDEPDAQQFCSIVWSVQTERAGQLLAMDDEAFCRALTRASEQWLGKVEQSAGRYSFPLRQRHAADYHANNLVLIGDAAHSIHPLAGQGANLGLQDAQALSQELLRALRTGRKLSDPLVLARYQRRRQPHNLGMMAVMEGFKRLYAEQPLPVRWLRNTAMKAVNRLPLLKQQLVREALG